MGFRAPYEDPVEVSYRLTPQGYVRVRRVEVKPYRRHELRLLAKGVLIQYRGQVRGQAQPESDDDSEREVVTNLVTKPTWSMFDRRHEQTADFQSRRIRRVQDALAQKLRKG